MAKLEIENLIDPKAQYGRKNLSQLKRSVSIKGTIPLTFINLHINKVSLIAVRELQLVV
jgi:hypothetical protein